MGRRKRSLMQRMFAREGWAAALLLRCLSTAASRLGLVRLARTRPARLVAHQLSRLLCLVLGVLKRIRQLMDRVRRARWFYCTWTTLLTAAACALLGQQLLQNPLIAAAAVLIGLYVAFAIARPFEAFLIWVALAPLVQAHDIELGRRIPNVTFDRVALTLVFGTLIARKLLSRKASCKVDLLDLTIGVFVVVCAANVFLMRITSGPLQIFSREMRAQESATTVGGLIGHYLYAFVAFYIVRNAVDSRRKMELFLLAVVSAVLYLVPIGIYEHYSGRSWFTQTGELSWTDVSRAAGPLKNPAVYGAILGVAFIFCLHMFFQSRRGTKRLLYTLTLLLIGVGEAVTFTRSAWLSPMVALVVLALLYEGKRKVLCTWLMVGAAAMAIAFPMLKQTSLYQERILARGPVEARVLITRVSVNMFKHKPVLGHGVGNFDYYAHRYRVYAPDIGMRGLPTSHNTFLTILVETGLVGFIPYVAVLAILARRWLIAYIRARNDPRVGGRQLVATMGCAAICYFVSALVIDMRFFRYVEYLFWCVLGLVAVQHTMLQTQSEQRESMTSRQRVKAA